jgi:hypothetical protein
MEYKIYMYQREGLKSREKEREGWNEGRRRERRGGGIHTGMRPQNSIINTPLLIFKYIAQQNNTHNSVFDVHTHH